jgi:eukaryotic-like serine/threonine-protein kinase
MQDSRWQLLQTLFAQAVGLPQREREPFIAAHCAQDPALADELRQLLRHDEPQRDAMPAALQAVAGAWVRDDRQAWVGRLLGPWRIVAHLADGGMGAVFRAERADGQYQQQVAIKLLNPALVSDTDRARLQAERQILARLAHPLIARLLDGGRTEDGAPYLVMEFVDGEPIDAWCNGRALDTAARLRLFVQVCQAVDHAHRNLVVHRDLKPSNILVDRNGTPRLLDFGIARLLDQDGLTRSSEQVLTPSHASPEQIVGAAITTASDVYALGVLLYDLLTGRLPHQANTGSPAAMARAIVETVPPRPSRAVTESGRSRRLDAVQNAMQRRGDRLSPERLARELQGDLDNIVLMALRKEPDRRYATAQALADDIERHLSHRPVLARPDTLAYRASKFRQRHPVAVPLSVLSGLLVLVAAGTFTWRLAAERDRALAAEARTRRAAAFSAAVLQGTSADEGAARQVSVLNLLDRAVKRAQLELAGDPAVSAQVELALGSALSSWGAYEDALVPLRHMLSTARQRGDEGRRDAALALSQLGSVLHDLGQLDESMQATRDALTLWQAVGTPAEQASAVGDLAMALNSLRRRTEAEPVFRDAIARLRRVHGGDHSDLAFMLNNLAWGLHAMGRYDEARPLYEEALAMQQRLGEGLPVRGQTLNNLAGLFYDQGELAQAERRWRELLLQQQALYGANGHAAVTRTEALLSTVLMASGQLDEAEELAARAQRGNLRLLGEPHRWSAASMAIHAQTLLALGRLDEAEALWRRVLAVRQQVLPAGHSSLAAVHLGLGRVAMARGRLPKAEAEGRQALSILRAMTSPDRVPLDEVLILVARAAARQGRRDEARVLSEEAVAVLRQQRPPGHYRRLAVEAEVQLPPFVAVAAAPALQRAQQTWVDLQQRLGPQAPVVTELGAALAAAGVPPEG